MSSLATGGKLYICSYGCTLSIKMIRIHIAMMNIRLVVQILLDVKAQRNVVRIIISPPPRENSLKVGLEPTIFPALINYVS